VGKTKVESRVKESLRCGVVTGKWKLVSLSGTRFPWSHKLWSQGGHKNRETEIETELTEISVFYINRYFFGFHLY
jgi:hypothetical protein